MDPPTRKYMRKWKEGRVWNTYVSKGQCRKRRKENLREGYTNVTDANQTCIPIKGKRRICSSFVFSSALVAAKQP